MFNRIGCYLTGHDYGIRCESGRMYLRCRTCGHTSEGWSVSVREISGDRAPRPSESPRRETRRAEAGAALR